MGTTVKSSIADGNKSGSEFDDLHTVYGECFLTDRRQSVRQAKRIFQTGLTERTCADGHESLAEREVGETSKVLERIVTDVGNVAPDENVFQLVQIIFMPRRFVLVIIAVIRHRAGDCVAAIGVHLFNRFRFVVAVSRKVVRVAHGIGDAVVQNKGGHSIISVVGHNDFERTPLCVQSYVVGDRERIARTIRNTCAVCRGIPTGKSRTTIRKVARISENGDGIALIIIVVINRHGARCAVCVIGDVEVALLVADVYYIGIAVFTLERSVNGHVFAVGVERAGAGHKGNDDEVKLAVILIH